jgi:hypothetical protein
MVVSIPWPLAAVLPPEPALFASSVERARVLSYTHVEVAALAERPAEHLEALAEAGVLVGCATLSGDLGGSAEERREALRCLERQVADASRLGATCVVLTLPRESDPAADACLAEACALLAAYAGRRMVRLAVRPRESSMQPPMGSQSCPEDAPAGGRGSCRAGRGAGEARPRPGAWSAARQEPRPPGGTGPLIGVQGPEQAQAWPDNLGLALEGEDVAAIRQAGSRLFHAYAGGRPLPGALVEALGAVGYRGEVGVRAWDA